MDFVTLINMPSPSPGKITSIVACSASTMRSQGARANVFIDGEFSFSLNLESVYRYGLKKGMAIDETLLKVLLGEDADSKALTQAVHYLNYRARSEGEIRQKLEKKEFTEDTIERTLDKLRRNGLVDDAKFARDWVTDRSRIRPRSTQILRQELRSKGIAKEIIEQVLPNQSEELQNASSVLQKIMRKRTRQWGSLDDRERRQKAIQFLARRGFGYDIAKAAWEEWEAENEEP